MLISGFKGLKCRFMIGLMVALETQENKGYKLLFLALTANKRNFWLSNELEILTALGYTSLRAISHSIKEERRLVLVKDYGIVWVDRR